MRSLSPACGGHEPWYRYGLAVLCLEMLIALAVSAYSLYVTFHGPGGFLR